MPRITFLPQAPIYLSEQVAVMLGRGKSGVGTSTCVPVILHASTNKSQCVQRRDDSIDIFLKHLKNREQQVY